MNGDDRQAHSVAPRRSEPRRFAEALNNAVHDAYHELPPADAWWIAGEGSGTSAQPGGRVVHYWDTDSLFWPAFGFLADSPRSETRAWREPRRRHPGDSRADEDLLVGALLSAGFLGRVRLVTAHRFELLQIIAKFTRNRAEESVNYRHALTSFTRKHGLDSVLNDVVQAVRLVDSGKGDTDLQKAAIRRLNQIDSRSFSFIESLSGTWSERVIRLLNPEDGLVSATDGGPSIEEVQQSPYLESFGTD